MFESIVLQHAEQAAFLWLLRERAVHAPHYTVKDLARLDSCIESHLDGLRVAGPSGLELCMELLIPAEPNWSFSMTAIAADQRPELLTEFLARMSGNPWLAKPMIAALNWIGPSVGLKIANALLDDPDVLRRYVGLSVCACLRQLKLACITDLIRDESELVRARALRSIGECGRKDLWHVLHRCLDDASSQCRYWAAWSACLLSQQDGVQVLWQTAQAANLRLERTAELVALCLSGDAALAWHNELVSSDQSRLALVAARSLLDPRLVPWLFQQMEIPANARLAGEALCFLTGLDLARQDLETDAPAGFDAGPNDDPEDENVAMDPDEDLPWPHRELLERWWRQHGARFRPGQRYFLGQPLSVETLEQVLRIGTQRQRRVAALARARIKPPLVEIRARADRS